MLVVIVVIVVIIIIVVVVVKKNKGFSIENKMNVEKTRQFPNVLPWHVVFQKPSEHQEKG